jgi:hypothetical protein
MSRQELPVTIHAMTLQLPEMTLLASGLCFAVPARSGGQSILPGGHSTRWPI